MSRVVIVMSAVVRRVMVTLVAALAFLVFMVDSGAAQITSTSTNVVAQITAGAGPGFDSGVVIAVAAIAILMAIKYVSRALRAR